MKDLNILSRTEASSNVYPTTKDHQGGFGNSRDESDAKIFSVPDSETGQESVPCIQLEMVLRLPQQA